MTYHKRKSFSSSKVLLNVVVALILLSIVNLMHYSTELLTLDRGSTNSGDILSSQHVLGRRTSLPSKTFDSIVNETNQVFMTMPCKAAGTTMKSFTQKCMNKTTSAHIFKRSRDSFITDNDEVPSIFQGWLQSDTNFVDVVKGSTRETLILYLHREELSRVSSAIQQVLTRQICIGQKPNAIDLRTKYEIVVERHENRCIIQEENLVRLINGKEKEIGLGSNKLMTCNYFDAIAQNTPSNLVFVNYKQADKLQQILAKHHCPHLLKDLPMAKNVAANKMIEPFIRLKTNSSREVTFKEWFDNKKNVILWALDLKSNMDCQSKIMDMEDHLFSCPDEAVTLFRGVYQCVSLS